MTTSHRLMDIEHDRLPTDEELERHTVQTFAEFVREVLDYNPDTGSFIWKHRPRLHFVSEREWKRWNARHQGKAAGGVDGKGYLQIGLNGVKHYAHRLAWLYVHGQLPKAQIDHIDRNKANNALSNLHDVTDLENKRNRPIQANNSTGVNGVEELQSGKFRAHIRIDGRRHYLGTFDHPEHAATVRQYVALEEGFDPTHGLAPGETPPSFTVYDAETGEVYELPSIEPSTSGQGGNE
ncbi:MAG: HNH endonuclease [Mesorhizobium sp.]